MRGLVAARGSGGRRRFVTPGRWGEQLLGAVGRLGLESANRAGESLLDAVGDLGARPEVERAARAAKAPLLVAGALLSLAGALGISILAVGLVTQGVTAAANQLKPAEAGPVRYGKTVTEHMSVLTGKMDGRAGWPRFTNASWRVHEGGTVVLRITSYDDGAAPLTGAHVMFAKVEGTLGGYELVNGKRVEKFAPFDIAHTFTVVGLGLNIPIPPAPSGGKVTVVARFVPDASGTFVWQCYAPCGTGPNAMGGAMSIDGWMEGTVRVTA